MKFSKLTESVGELTKSINPLQGYRKTKLQIIIYEIEWKIHRVRSLKDIFCKLNQKMLIVTLPENQNLFFFFV